MILLKLFANNYGSQIELFLVFDNSKLLGNSETIKQYESDSFKLINARPKFEIADDLLVSEATALSESDKESSLFITSDRML